MLKATRRVQSKAQAERADDILQSGERCGVQGAEPSSVDSMHRRWVLPMRARPG